MKLDYSADLRQRRIPLTKGIGAIPGLGFGTLIPDPAETRRATQDAFEAGFRHFDCAERYGNEQEVGDPRTPGRARENFNIAPLPEDAFEQINHIETRQRFNTVVTTGVPGFIPQRG